MNTPAQMTAPPQLTNNQVNTIINGLTELHKFQYEQLNYADQLLINVLREQKKDLEEDCAVLKEQLERLTQVVKPSKK